MKQSDKSYSWDRERELDDVAVTREQWEEQPTVCPGCCWGAWGEGVVDERGTFWHRDCFEKHHRKAAA